MGEEKESVLLLYASSALCAAAEWGSLRRMRMRRKHRITGLFARVAYCPLLERLGGEH